MKLRASLYLTAAVIFSVLAIPKVIAQCTRSCGQDEVSVTPYQLTFSSQAMDTTSPPQPVEASTGILATSITGISVTGPFSQTNDCPSVLLRFRHCEIQVRFQPRAAGSVTGQLTIEASGMHRVALTGLGTHRSALSHASSEVAAKQHTHYMLIDFGTLGGPQSYVFFPNSYAPVLNNHGFVAGWADTDEQDPFSPNFCFNFDCNISHAFRSWDGTLTDLGALPGGASSASAWIGANDLIAGLSENGQTDPTFGGPVVHAVLWKNKVITDLKTLKGGYESVGLAVNSRGQVAGAGDNDIPDATPMISDVYGWTTQTRAFLWQDGVMKDLGTLGGTDAAAFLINERGQVAGVSYTDANPSSYCSQQLGSFNTTGAFLWEDGRMKNLGSFGGTCTFATDLNNQGEVVGLSTLPGDQFQHAFLWRDNSLHDLRNTDGGHNGAAIAINSGGEAVGWASLTGDQMIHASLWKNGIMTDLGTLDGDPCSIGFSINAAGQVVGISGYQQDLSGCNSGNTHRAFLWEGGSMVDLNTLIPPDSPLYLTDPETINDLGEIAGVGLDSNENEHAFLLIPSDGDDATWQDVGEASAAQVRAMPTRYPTAANPTHLVQKVPGRHIALPQQ